MEKFVPKTAKGAAVRRMAVSAHKDDVEMLALHGIAECYENGGFAAAVLTDGGACPRSREYASVTDEDMAELRTAEQKRAAEEGRYEALWLFEKSSGEIKRQAKEGGDVVEGLAEIFRSLPRLDVLYLHSPFDRHPTHVAACLAALAALKLLEDEQKPLKVCGCEVWRDLDWLSDIDKAVMDVSGSDELAARLMSCFVSQNSVKRYDIAAAARRKANATFWQSHEGDEASSLIYGVDLTGLAYGGDTEKFVKEKIENFAAEVKKLVFAEK